MRGQIIIRGMGCLCKQGYDIQSLQKYLEGTIKDELSDEEINSLVSKSIGKGNEQIAQYMSYATSSAFLDARVEEDEIDEYNIGIAVGTSQGGMKSLKDAADKISTLGSKGIRPMSAMNCIMCGAGAKVAIEKRIKGFNLTNVNGITASLDALVYAIDMLKSKDMEYAIVCGAEEYNRAAAGAVLIQFSKEQCVKKPNYARVSSYFRRLFYGDELEAQINAMIDKLLEKDIELVITNSDILIGLFQQRKENVLVPKQFLGDTYGANGMFSLIVGCINSRKNILLIEMDEKGLCTSVILEK